MAFIAIGIAIATLYASGAALIGIGVCVLVFAEFIIFRVATRFSTAEILRRSPQPRGVEVLWNVCAVTVAVSTWLLLR